MINIYVGIYRKLIHLLHWTTATKHSLLFICNTCIYVHCAQTIYCGAELNGMCDVSIGFDLNVLITHWWLPVA